MFRNPVTDLIVVLVVALLILGPKRLPMLGRSLGHGLREFKEGITGESKPDEADRPALTAAAPVDSAVATPAAPAAAAAPVSPQSPGSQPADAAASDHPA